MNKKLVQAMSLILVVILAVSAAVLCVGCGEEDDAAKATASTEATAATGATAATAAAATQADGQAAATQAQTGSGSQNTGSDTGFISQQDAVAKVRQQAGTGAQVLDVYQGNTAGGDPMWIITVSPITNSDNAVVHTYYVGNDFCYLAETSENNVDDASDDGFISDQDAIAMVRQYEGTGAQIINYYKGTTAGDLPAWIITVAPVTNSEEAVYRTYYVGNDFCYAVD